MDYTLRVARRRPQGGVDTSRAIFDAPTVAAAIAYAIELTEHILAGQAGVALLSSKKRGRVWSHRYGLFPPPPLSNLPRER